jgi:hypothetical protein
MLPSMHWAAAQITTDNGSMPFVSVALGAFIEYKDLT